MIEKKSGWKQYGKAGQTLEMDRYDKETPDSYRSVYSELFSEFGVEVTKMCIRDRFSRAGAEKKEIYKPGILKEKDGEWKLYTVEKIYKIPDKNAYKKGKKIKVKVKQSYRTEIENEVRCLVADDNTKFRMGDSVEPEIESGMYVSKLSLVNESDQYVYVGEAFSNKKFERVFKIGEEINDLRENAVKDVYKRQR